MKIDFTADAPFSIKEDIDDLYNRYIYITHVSFILSYHYIVL